jgi:hypothetical protein
VLVVVVVEEVGAMGMVVVDSSVVLVRVVLSEPPQLASKPVPTRSAAPISNLRADFMSVIGNSLWDDFSGTRNEAGQLDRRGLADDAAQEVRPRHLGSC